MAASDTVGMVGSVGSLIPYVGPIIGAAGSIVSGILKNNEAKDQAARAAELRKKSASLQKGLLRPEYAGALNADKMAALYGLPEYSKYIDDIDEGVAKNARAILESSPNGAASLAAISATLSKANAAKESIYLKDAMMREQKERKVADRLWDTGDKQMDLVNMQRADKRDLNQGAMNLENAATANRVGSIDQILASVAAGAQGLGKLAMGAKGAPATGNTNITINPTADNSYNGGLMSGDIYNLQNTTTSIPSIPSFKTGGADDATLAAVLQYLKTNPQYNTQWQ